MSSIPAGYSGTPLPKKLGIQEGIRVLLVNEPTGFRAILTSLPDGADLVTAADPPLGFVHLFVTTAAVLTEQLASLRPKLAPDGVLWVSWPKKTSGVKTDVTEDTIRAVALPLGLVDVKVCARRHVVGIEADGPGGEPAEKEVRTGEHNSRQKAGFISSVPVFHLTPYLDSRSRPSLMTCDPSPVSPNFSPPAAVSIARSAAGLSDG
ncbi:MAG: hypothetical protein JWO38_2631 [Gemmataceae bacterium]|nr:hypothetical protein [Gemmataceae bacterium]